MVSKRYYHVFVLNLSPLPSITDFSGVKPVNQRNDCGNMLILQDCDPIWKYIFIFINLSLKQSPATQN